MEFLALVRVCELFWWFYPPILKIQARVLGWYFLFFYLFFSLSLSLSLQKYCRLLFSGLMLKTREEENRIRK